LAAVEGIPLRAAFGVDGGRWEKLGVAVGVESYVPAAVVVQEPVVATTDQTGVAEGGGATIGPRDQMVALRPTGRPIARREGASAIAEDQGAA